MSHTQAYDEIFLAWREVWHPAEEPKRYSALTWFRWTFDPDKPEDTAPFTPQEVVSDVGWIDLRIAEANSRPDDLRSGVLTTNPPRHVQYTIADLQAEWVIYTPASSDGSLAESYADAIEPIFTGFYRDSADPWELRRDRSQGARRLSGASDGTWRTSSLMLAFELRYRTEEPL